MYDSAGATAAAGIHQIMCMSSREQGQPAQQHPSYFVMLKNNYKKKKDHINPTEAT